MTRFPATVFAAALLAAASQPALAETLKLGTLAPEGSPWHEVIRDIAEDWKAQSSGDLEVRIYAGGVIGDEHDMVRKMRIGQLHAAALTGDGLSRIAPEIKALMIPMMVRSDDELNYVRDRLHERLARTMAERGFILLTWGDAGWVHFFAQEPVVHPDDLKPLRLFTWAGDDAVVETYKRCGYNPVPLAAPEIHTALQSGLINAFPTTPIAALSFQWFGLAPHMTDLKWAPLVGAVVITKRAWERLPEELRPRLRAAAQTAGKRLQARVRRLGEDAVRVMQQHGLTVHPVPPEMVEVWEQTTRNCFAGIIDRLAPVEMVREVERLRNAYRAAQGQ